MGVRRVVPASRERARRAVEDDRSSHEHKALDEVLHDAELVGDVQNRHAELPVEAGEQVSERFLPLGIDAGRRLVEDEQVGLAGERLRHEGPLLLAAGEARERAIGQRPKPDTVDRLPDMVPVVAAQRAK